MINMSSIDSKDGESSKAEKAVQPLNKELQTAENEAEINAVHPLQKDAFIIKELAPAGQVDHGSNPPPIRPSNQYGVPGILYEP